MGIWEFGILGIWEFGILDLVSVLELVSVVVGGFGICHAQTHSPRKDTSWGLMEDPTTDEHASVGAASPAVRTFAHHYLFSASHRILCLLIEFSVLSKFDC